MIRLSPGNTHWIQVSELVRKDTGEFINDAVVEITIYESDGETAVDGETWPVALTSSGSDGYYSATTGSSADFEDGEQYIIEITATSGTNVATWQEATLAKTRRF